MLQCQYPGCTAPAKVKWCPRHNAIVANERAAKRWRQSNGSPRRPSRTSGYAAMLMSYNRDERDKGRVDYSSRPTDYTGVEYIRWTRK